MVSMRCRGDTRVTYGLQLLHGGLVCLSSTEQVGSVAVAELCVGRGRAFVLAVAIGTAQRVVLLGDVLCEVWRNHLFNLLGLVCLGFFRVFGVSMQVPCSLRGTLVVVAMHQGGVGMGRGSGRRGEDVGRVHWDSPRETPLLRAWRRRLQGRIVGCDRLNGVGGVGCHGCALGEVKALGRVRKWPLQGCDRRGQGQSPGSGPSEDAIHGL